MKRLNNQGMGHLVLLVAAIVVVAISVVGLRLTRTDAPTASTVGRVGTIKAPASIKSTADLDKASQSLNTTPIDNSLDTSSLDTAIGSLY
jgi:hypothetical protein